MSQEILEFLPVIGFAVIFSLMAIYRGREILRTGDQPFTDKKIRDEDRQLVGYSLVASGIILFIAVLGYLVPNPAVDGFICLSHCSKDI